MDLGRILFIAIFFLSATTLLTVSSALETVKNSIKPPAEIEAQIKFSQKQQDLEKSYKENLTKAFSGFKVNKTKLNKDELGNLENQLLSLIVPRNLTDLHFKLVSAISDIIQNPAESEKQATKERLDDLLKNYSWLASSLSLFLMQNF
jgi:hypothetical protein